MFGLPLQGEEKFIDDTRGVVPRLRWNQPFRLLMFGCGNHVAVANCTMCANVIVICHNTLALARGLNAHGEKNRLNGFFLGAFVVHRVKTRC